MVQDQTGQAEDSLWYTPEKIDGDQQWVEFQIVAGGKTIYRVPAVEIDDAYAFPSFFPGYDAEKSGDRILYRKWGQQDNRDLDVFFSASKLSWGCCQ